MRREGEAMRDRGEGLRVRAPTAAALAAAEVSADLKRIFGPPAAPAEAPRGVRAKVVGGAATAEARAPRRMAPLAAAVVVGVVGGGLLAWSLLPRTFADGGAGQGLRTMIALAPGLADAPPPPPGAATQQQQQQQPGSAASPATASGAPAAAPQGDRRRPLENRRPRSGEDEAGATTEASIPSAPLQYHGNESGAALNALAERQDPGAGGPGARTDAEGGCGLPEGRCVTTRDAVAADRRVRQAYAEAAAAGVSEDVLTGLRRSWEEVRDRFNERPADLVVEYGRLADALVRARDRARIRSGEEADARSRSSPNR